MPRRNAVVLIAAIAIAGCTGKPRELGRAGSHVVTEADVVKRQKAVRAQYRETDGEMAMRELCTAGVAAELLARHGLAIGTDELKAEAERIDRETKEPALLARVKAELGDSADYQRLFVLSSLAPRRLQREVFATPQAQGEAFTRAQRLWELARGDKRPFHAWALPEGVSVSRMLAADMVERSAAEKAWLEGLSPGERAPSLIDAPDRYLVFRRLARPTRAGEIFELLSIPKESWDSWLARQKATVALSGACASV